MGAFFPLKRLNKLKRSDKLEENHEKFKSFRPI